MTKRMKRHSRLIEGGNLLGFLRDLGTEGASSPISGAQA
jgi:hypothetical protein